MRVVFDDFAQGDSRPVVVRITPRSPYAPPAPPLTVISGSWVLVQAQTGNPATGMASPSSGTLSVNTQVQPFSFIATVPIVWSTPGQYVMRFDLTWSDNTIDNTLSAAVTVDAPAV